MSKSNETAETRRKTQVNSIHEGYLDSLTPYDVKGSLSVTIMYWLRVLRVRWLLPRGVTWGHKRTLLNTVNSKLRDVHEFGNRVCVESVAKLLPCITKTGQMVFLKCACPTPKFVGVTVTLLTMSLNRFYFATIMSAELRSDGVTNLLPSCCVICNSSTMEASHNKVTTKWAWPLCGLF